MQNELISSLHCTRAERIQRLGELLAKGVALMLQQDGQNSQITIQPPETESKAAHETGRTPRFSPKVPPSPTSTEPRCPIHNYLLRVRTASPREIQRALGMSKASVFRHLDALAKSGAVVRSGKTTSVRYRLVARPGNSRTSTHDQNFNVFQRPIAVGRETEKART